MIPIQKLCFVFALTISSVLTTASWAIDIQRVISPSGIEAWLVEEKAIPLVTMEVGFRGGSFEDPEGREGLADMLSALLTEGSGDMDALAFQTRLEESAIRLGFSVGRDTFYGSLSTLSENVDEAFELFNLALLQPRFDEDAIERTRKRLLVALSRAEESPQSTASKTWFDIAFGGKTYGRPRHGTKESLNALSMTDLMAQHKAQLVKDDLKIGVVGDISAAELGPLLDKTFQSLPNAGAPGPIEPAVIVSLENLTVLRREIPQSVVLFGFQGLLRSDPDFIPAFVMNHILGSGGFTSRLMQEVREKRGLAYGVYTYLLPLDHAGIYLGSVATENGRVVESLDVIKGELERIHSDGVTQQELDDAKTYLTGSYPLRFDSNSKIAQQLVGIQMEDLGIDYIERRNGTVNAVTLDDVSKAAQRLVKLNKMITVVVGNPDGIDTP